MMTMTTTMIYRLVQSGMVFFGMVARRLLIVLKVGVLGKKLR